MNSTLLAEWEETENLLWAAFEKAQTKEKAMLKAAIAAGDAPGDFDKALALWQASVADLAPICSQLYAVSRERVRQSR